MSRAAWAAPTGSLSRQDVDAGHSPAYALALLLSFSLGPSVFASATAWQVPGAVLKFTLEADPNQPQVPGVNVSGQRTGKIDWSGAYYRIDGKTYKNAIAMISPGKAAYPCKVEYRRFTALIGVREDASESAAIVFEVSAGTRKLYTSPPLTKYSAPLGIDVRIPPKAKEITLAATGSSEGHHWAGWVNAGFQTRDDNPRVGYVTLPVPGFDPAKYEVVVFTANGTRVGSSRLTAREGKIDQLFFGGQGWTTYYAYLVPRDQYGPGPRDWAPDAGLVLETRRVDKSRQRECEDLAGLVKVWNGAGPPVGRSLVTGIHHGYPVHPLLLDAGDATAKNSLALYRYTGFFEADRAGEYVFSTASNWGSHLLVDDKLVVSWPGNHDYREGIRGQKQGQLTLQPGVHKLDYFNYSPWGTMFTLAAWQPPGGKLGVMTGHDFPSVRGFVVTGVESDPSREKKVLFDWDVVDDWRLDRDQAALIRMRFHAIPERRTQDRGPKTEDGEQKVEDREQKTEDNGPKTEDKRLKTVPSSVLRPPSSETRPASSDFRWTFGDGIVMTGQTAERVFLGPGQHTVTLQILKGDQTLVETAQSFYAGASAQKIWVEPRDPDAFRHGMAQVDFRRRPVREVVRLYTLGDDLQEPPWRKAAEQILLERAGELIAQPEYQPLCLELAQHLCAASLQRYEQALGICTTLQEKTREGTPIRQQTMVLAGELSLRCLGKPDAALRLLNQARWEKAQDKIWTIRHGLVRAETLLALGQWEELAQQMRQLADLQKPQDVRRQELRHAGLLRQAQSLVRSSRNTNPPSALRPPQSDDPSPADTALASLQTILYEDPQQVLSPGLSLVRLDAHLARGEYRIARHLSQRLTKLEMTPYDRAEVLVRQVKALCAMNEPDSAKKILEELTRVYPSSEQASRARAIIVEAAKKTGS